MKTKTDAWPWLTRAQAGELIGLSPRQMDEVIRPRLADGGEQGTGKTLRINAIALVRAFTAYRVEQEAPKAFGADGDPLMSAGGDSPWLEEYRKQRAGQEAIKLNEMRYTVVPIDELEPVHARYGATIRQIGDALQRKYGPDAATMLNEGVDEAMAVVEKFLADVREKSNSVRDAEAGGALQDAPPSNDASVRRRRDQAPKRAGGRKKVSG